MKNKNEKIDKQPLTTIGDRQVRSLSVKLPLAAHDGMDGHGCRWILLFPRQDPPPKRKIRIRTFPLSRASLVSLWLCISESLLNYLFFPSSLLIFFRDFHVFLFLFHRFLSMARRYQLIQKIHSLINSALDKNHHTITKEYF